MMTGPSMTSWRRPCDTSALLSNKRMDQSWGGRLIVVGWHTHPCTGKFPASCRPTLVMRGR